MSIESIKNTMMLESFNALQVQGKKLGSSMPTKADVAKKEMAVAKKEVVTKYEDSKVNQKEMEAAVKEAIDGINERISHDVRMEIDKDTDKLVIKILDTKSGELIKQFPPEDLLTISKKMDELEAILFSEEV